MKEKRPVNLDLAGIRFPVTAITSILHRITGVLMFLCLPLLLWMLQQSFSGEVGFDTLLMCLQSPWVLFFSWVFLVVVGYHIIAGFRHILIDLNILPVTMCAGTVSSWVVLALSAIYAVCVGVWIW